MTIETLRRERDLIAIESFTVANLPQLVKDTLPRIVAGAKNVFANFVAGEKHEDVTLPSNQEDFLDLLGNHNYMDINTLNVIIPEGLKVDFLSYTENLIHAVDFCEYAATELDQYYTFLSRVLSDQDFNASSVFMSSKFKEINDRTKHLTEETQKCFHAVNGTTTKLNKVMHNNAGWERLFTVVNGLQGRINKVNRDQIQSKITDCTKLLDLLIKKANQGEFLKISPEVYNSLSQYTFSIASALETYSITYHRLTVFITAINQTVEKLTNILKK